MKINIYFRSFFFMAAVLLFCASSHAEADKPALLVPEKAYEDAVVALIDHKSGMIGATWKEEGSEKEEKLSFQVDTNKVDVTNPVNQYLEFSNISVGDHVDITTIKDSSGKEIVVEILDYNASDPDA